MKTTTKFYLLLFMACFVCTTINAQYRNTRSSRNSGLLIDRCSAGQYTPNRTSTTTNRTTTTTNRNYNSGLLINRCSPGRYVPDKTTPSNNTTNQKYTPTSSSSDLAIDHCSAGNGSFVSSSTSVNESSSPSRIEACCPNCAGSGLCKLCRGKLSYTPAIGASPVKCSCGNGKCGLCKGTGKYGHMYE